MYKEDHRLAEGFSCLKSAFFLRSKEREVTALTAQAAEETAIYSGMTSLSTVY